MRELIVWYIPREQPYECSFFLVGHKTAEPLPFRNHAGLENEPSYVDQKPQLSFKSYAVSPLESFHALKGRIPISDRKSISH